jgi:hypothetical protein
MAEVYESERCLAYFAAVTARGWCGSRRGSRGGSVELAERDLVRDDGLVGGLVEVVGAVEGAELPEVADRLVGQRAGPGGLRIGLVRRLVGGDEHVAVNGQAGDDDRLCGLLGAGGVGHGGLGEHWATLLASIACTRRGFYFSG